MLSAKQYRILKKIQRSHAYIPENRKDKYFIYFTQMHYLCQEYKADSYVYVVSPEGEIALESFEHDHFYQRLSMLISIGALITSIVSLMQ